MPPSGRGAAWNASGNGDRQLYRDVGNQLDETITTRVQATSKPAASRSPDTRAFSFPCCINAARLDDGDQIMRSTMLADDRPCRLRGGVAPGPGLHRFRRHGPKHVRAGTGEQPAPRLVGGRGVEGPCRQSREHQGRPGDARRREGRSIRGQPLLAAPFRTACHGFKRSAIRVIRLHQDQLHGSCDTLLHAGDRFDLERDYGSISL